MAIHRGIVSPCRVCNPTFGTSAASLSPPYLVLGTGSLSRELRRFFEFSSSLEAVDSAKGAAPGISWQKYDMPWHPTEFVRSRTAWGEPEQGYCWCRYWYTLSCIIIRRPLIILKNMYIRINWVEEKAGWQESSFIEIPNVRPDIPSSLSPFSCYHHKRKERQGHVCIVPVFSTMTSTV